LSLFSQAHGRKFLFIEKDASFIGMKKSHDVLKQNTFSASGTPDNDKGLSLPYLKTNALKHVITSEPFV